MSVEAGNMSAESLPPWRRINTRSSSRQVVEPPPAMDSDTSSSVPSPGCQSTSSSSPGSNKKGINEPEVPAAQDGGSAAQDGGSAAQDGGSAVQNGGAVTQNGGSATTAVHDGASGTQEGGFASQKGESPAREGGSAAQDGPSAGPSQDRGSATQGGGSDAQATESVTQDSNNPTPDESTAQSSGTAMQSSGSNLLPPSSPATSQGRESSSFCGGTYRKRKANFSNEETETLVKNVVKHFSALYGLEALRTESTRRNQRRSQLWNQIQRHVNGLGYTPRSIDDLKHKWRDIRLDVKRKVTTKRSSSSSYDPRLTPMEALVASTIGQSHLDGEHDGVYHEPGLPRQSIFYPLRGPSLIGENSRADRNNSFIAPKPEPSTPEIAVMRPAILTTTSQTPAILTTTTHLTFIAVPGVPVPEERAMDLSQPDAIDRKPSPQALMAVEEEAGPSLLAGVHNGDAGPCDSQGSMVSSPAGSLSQLATQPDWGNEGSSDKHTSDQIEAFSFKMEEEEEEEENEPGEGGSQEMDTGSLPSEPVAPAWQDGQEEWERQSGSPHRSETAREDSLHSSASQEGTRTPATDVPLRDGCSCLLEDRRPMWRTNMHRLLELEEQWDQLYHQELAMWEEERLQQREQRVQDRLLQQQLLGVLTDIRDELKQMREQRTASRENHAAPGPSQAGYQHQTSPSDMSSAESVGTAQVNGDSAPCSPKPAEVRSPAASESSTSWSPKSATLRGRPVSTASAARSLKPTMQRRRPSSMLSAAWSPKSVTQRTSGRPRGRPRKFPIDESYDGDQS